MSRLVARTFWTFLAVVFLIEAWLWERVGHLIAAAVAILPIERLRRGLRRLIDRGPVVLALALFAVPILVILPFKLLAMALFANGRMALGAGIFILAKTVGLGVTAFIFDVTRGRLMSMDWFAKLYAWVMRIADWAHAQVAPYKIAIRDLRARLAARFSANSGSLGKRIATLRDNVRRRIRATG